LHIKDEGNDNINILLDFTESIGAKEKMKNATIVCTVLVG
jgi:hypothetical protein